MSIQDKTKKHIHLPPGHTWRLPVLLAGLSFAALPLTAQASPASVSKTDAPITQALNTNTQTGWVSVIFKTASPLTSAQESQMSALGADIVRRLPIIGSVTVRVPAHNLAKLAALPFATHLSLDGKVQKTDAFTVGSSEASQATVTTKYGWFSQTYQLTGAGVTVAVLDSGVTPVADLSSQAGDIYNRSASRVLANVNFSTALTKPTFNFFGALPLVSSSNNLSDPCGHGTHVAGIIAGNGSRSPAFYCTQTCNGIAPQANLVNVRVLDVNGESTVSTVISGLQWVLNNQNRYKIRVVNLSLGHPVGESYTTDPICQAVEALYNAGIVVVCAAGNDGRVNGDVNTPGFDNEGWGTAYGSVQSPGNDPYIITVGATKSMDGIRADDKIATYSSRGPSRLDLIMKPDIIAPGNKVISLDAHGSMLDTYGGGANQVPYSYYVGPFATMALGLNGSSADYFQLSGTSMASPVVAGAAALLLQANPSLTPDTIKARLMLSADKWFAADGTEDPLTYGAGYLNIPAALASTVV
ncbi:MAG: S8 family peptidase, partial [Janthinobacterium lividum]